MTDELGTQILASVNLMRSENAEVRTELAAHMKDEGKEIKAIHDKLEDWRKAAEARHDSLVASLGSFMERADTTSAFPENKKGKPDLDGHRAHHETLIEEAELSKQRAEDLKRKWMDKAGWALMVFVAFAVWEYIKAHLK